jgi:hypothetical protein
MVTVVGTPIMLPQSPKAVPLQEGHHQQIYLFGRIGFFQVDVLRESHQRHPSGRLLRVRRQFNTSRSISPTDHCLTVSSRAVSLLL